MYDIVLARHRADELTKKFEDYARKRPDGSCEAYPDAYSPLGKALRRAGLWLKYLAGTVEIPANLAGLSGAPWTIGWGQTGREVFKGVVWSRAQADERHLQEIAMVDNAIRQHLLTRVPTTNQLAALISFAFNVGLDIDEDTKAEGLGDSTLLKKFNRGDIQGAADGFMNWVYAQGEKSNGLVRRRTDERALFLRTT